MRSENLMSAGGRGAVGMLLMLGLGAGCGGPVEPEAAPAVGEARQATRGFIPDLSVEEITRDSHYFKVRYCNWTSYGSDASFVISLRNELSGQTFTSGPMTMPASGACLWTGGITCGLVGMVCDEAGTLTATVDAQQEVVEAYEYNNALTVEFPQNLVRPDLVVEEVVRVGSAYRARYCNRGNSGHLASFYVDWRNGATSASYTPSTSYTVPAPGQCAWTEGVACFWVGSNCADTVSLSVSADASDSVSELDEGNNALVVDFTPSTALSDLTAADIWRDGDYFYVSYCNQGGGNSSARFTVKLTNLTTWQSFYAGTGAPYMVPAPGTCGVTDPIHCSAVGCGSVPLSAFVDNSFEVFESNESNNTLERSL
ncbi:hypothetical protein P2318_03055 [Myxococcaceae bacterium GXIMD 01537]